MRVPPAASTSPSTTRAAAALPAAARRRWSADVAPFSGLLADQRQARVITPVHPGFGGTDRPAWLTDVPTLARAYARLLDERGLEDVAVVGKSMGGWIAAELALLASDRISRVVLVNPVGIQVPGHPIADTFSLTPAELSQLAFHDPAKFAIAPAALPRGRPRGHGRQPCRPGGLLRAACHGRPRPS